MVKESCIVQTRSKEKQPNKTDGGAPAEAEPTTPTTQASSGLWVVLILAIPLVGCLVWGYLTR